MVAMVDYLTTQAIQTKQQAEVVNKNNLAINRSRLSHHKIPLAA